MGTPINTPLTSEIWHLTIDDLLEPLPASPCLGGPGPFVINLSASTAPISLPMKSVADCPGAHVYQIQRTEDRRVRYRLRLGPFETEAEAEALLSQVREIYPSALAASAESEDLRAIESIKAKIEAQQLAAVKAAMNKAAAAALPNAPRASTMPAPAPEPAAEKAETEPLASSPPPAWLALQASVTPPRTVAAAPKIAPTAAAAENSPPMTKTRSIANAAVENKSPFDKNGSSGRAQAVERTPMRAPLESSPSIRSAIEPPPASEPSSPPGDPVIPVLSDSITVTRPLPVFAAPVRPTPAPMAFKTFTAPPPAARTSSTAAVAPSTISAPSRPTVTPRVAMPSVAPAASSARVPEPTPFGTLPAHPAASTSTENKPWPASPLPAAPVRVATPPLAPLPGAPLQVVPPPRRVAALSTPLPGLDTTQTLRPLTAQELQDAAALRSFVIQLSLSDQGFDPDALPNLDIFSEYRLYSVSVFDQGKPMHALRLGFFSSEAAAAAVASYLATFYDNPVVKRISAAERERFSTQGLEARKDIGATGRHAVIEITDERVIRPKRSAYATLSSMPPRPSDSTAPPMDKGK